MIDQQALARRRQSPACELCRKPTPAGCEPHHWITRGMGGGRRLDVDMNLIGLCHLCHTKVHMGNISRLSVLAAIARRERRAADEIASELWALARRPK